MEHTFAASIAALLITGTVITGFFALENHFSPEEENLPAETEISASEEEEEKMFLGVFEEKLALFVGKSQYPDTVYDFFIRNLPPEDRERLFEGIPVSSERELESLLEDFMS
ncbi:MAG: hypothetical protein E7479_02930 [Ruminococcaceae bacterium]|nr:hypothetical protein [Oscillospiraceae bacterium]